MSPRAHCLSFADQPTREATARLSAISSKLCQKTGIDSQKKDSQKKDKTGIDIEKMYRAELNMRITGNGIFNGAFLVFFIF